MNCSVVFRRQLPELRILNLIYDHCCLYRSKSSSYKRFIRNTGTMSFLVFSTLFFSFFCVKFWTAPFSLVTFIFFVLHTLMKILRLITLSLYVWNKSVFFYLFIYLFIIFTSVFFLFAKLILVFYRQCTKGTLHMQGFMKIYASCRQQRQAEEQELHQNQNQVKDDRLSPFIVRKDSRLALS